MRNCKTVNHKKVPTLQNTQTIEMTPGRLRVFCCPNCMKSLFEKEGLMLCPACQNAYSCKEGVVCFLKDEHYTDSFGYQWNIHSQTQLDKFNGTEISKERFWRQSQWKKEDLKGKKILEIGSGAGRFTEIALSSESKVYSLEASVAIEANQRNNHCPNLTLVKASLFNQPFLPESFDFMFCFGVIQHTPDVEKAFKSLFQALKKNGKFCVDVYASPIAYLHPRHLFRPFTKRMKREKLYAWVKRLVPILLPLSNLFYKIPFVGPYLARLVPIANWQYLNLKNKEQSKEWSILDTFDWYSPQFESPQNHQTLERWCRELNLKTFEIIRYRGLFVIRGEK